MAALGRGLLLVGGLWLAILAANLGGRANTDPLMVFVGTQAGASGPTPALEVYDTSRQLQVTVYQGDGLRTVSTPLAGWRVALTEQGNAQTVLSVVELPGRARRIVTTYDAPSGNVAWSPDGTQLAYDVRNQLQVVEAATGRVQLSYDDMPMSYPVWGAMGQRLALLVYPDIYQFSLEEKRARLWLDLPRNRRAYRLAWSPGGRWLAYILLPQDTDVYLHDTHTDTTQVSRVLSLITVRELAWLDEERLAVVGGRSSLTPEAALLHLSTGEIEPLRLPPNYRSSLAWLR